MMLGKTLARAPLVFRSARSFTTLAETLGLKRTALFNLHQELGGKMVPFAGWEMPVQYPEGVLKEHMHCRNVSSLFDVSHPPIPSML
eukprot:TRINITY_DN7005_c0_g1_i1.p1 TRINITY_DN7005_c0_g1~~TRINITY_DN7005_c0_g1_i1.p1  ORF type:complete len:87 (+),score=15.20 TRINITY_DN7005_c0_g1_i1:49-309(+)